jgi:hypothetical protein
MVVGRERTSKKGCEALDAWRRRGEEAPRGGRNWLNQSSGQSGRARVVVDSSIRDGGEAKR